MKRPLILGTILSAILAALWPPAHRPAGDAPEHAGGGRDFRTSRDAAERGVSRISSRTNPGIPPADVDSRQRGPRSAPDVPAGGTPLFGKHAQAPTRAFLAERARLARPAVSVEIPDSAYLSDNGQRALQSFAEDWYEEVGSFPEKPGTPAFDERWIDAVRTADFAFRQRFGQHAWRQHHIQARQLAQQGGEYGSPR